MPLVMRSKA